MYINEDDLKAGFYRVTKQLVDDVKNSDKDSDWFELAVKLDGMVELIDELTKEEK